MKKDVMLVTGAGQISMAIARRMGYGKKIVLGDTVPKNRTQNADFCPIFPLVAEFSNGWLIFPMGGCFFQWVQN